MMTPEGKVKKGISKILKARGVYYYMPSQSGYGTVGIPDYICCLAGGKFLAIEAKAPGKRNGTTPNQKMQLHLIHCAGGGAIVVDDPQQLEDYFNGCYEKSDSETQIHQGNWT